MKILVATIVKPQGLKGEMKISCHTDRPEQLRGIKHLYLGEMPIELKSLRVLQSGVFVTLEGIKDRTQAETLRGGELFADRSDLALPEGSYLIADLVGSAVFLDDGTMLGEVADVLQHGAADVFVINGEKEIQFPFLKDLVAKIDVQNKMIVLKKQRFSEVALYED